MTRTLLITGCSSGIGHDAAHALSARGWRVFASVRDPGDLPRLRDEGLEALHLDYADQASIETAVAHVLSATQGRLDAVFNNGAFAIPGPLEDITRAAMRAQFEVNLLGPHALTRAVIPVMRRQGHGRIVNCSSVLGLVAAPWRGPYNASKFAMEGMTDTLRVELAGSGIHPILIEPGPIRTEFRRNAIAAFEKWVDWEASERAQDYRDWLLDKLYKRGPSAGRPARFELGPEAVTARLIRALEDPRPRARYMVTTPTYGAAVMRRLLPARLIDRMVRNA
ncbi:SDR family NAD(P)-dependent oxidoreductase [Pseudooceanicola sediminis]|uniref:SDR family NAD(P)-dependent oxidoreductase n=1 Tax=Pseudooceanicola sediminis TaxID=2211117 RepID=A0A399IUW4_9RHOB|nr:SDR family NAD(P)-dependent oxidoreductase [Pseudooceanicola sediminis]KAA2314911.1 SDR family NAD(P)-dependent oxidoreductase [Puniceibacterium sp. HSS470]RII36935.1 SDR family NAD(P)-dependent oxidoreductase [Pseudooceanicola sediminis]|tara:strand:+ start:6634 stop:7473 length:840 start_codon:yes stop_codon:yes gene_type:complete